MIFPHRGFNIYGPSTSNPNYQPDGTHNYDIYDVSRLAERLNANVIRHGFSWAAYEPTQGSYNRSQIDHIKALVDAGREHSPNLKALVCVGNIPSWVPGRVPDPTRPGTSNYTTSPDGYSLYGQMCVKVLQDLSGYADCVEHSNEPNGIARFDGTEIPATNYGGMAGYAAFWIDYCLGPSKYALVGALASNSTWKVYLGQMMDEVYSLCRQFYPLETNSLEFIRLLHSIRISYHAYPNLIQSNWITAINQVEGNVGWLHSSYPDHKIWITETGASSVTMTSGGQTNFMLGMCYQVCGPRPRVEGMLFWPCTDAEGYAWDSSSPFYRFGVAQEDGTTLKQAGVSIKSAFATPTWTGS